jgi:osmotically-inducible protein OsmY
MEVVEMDEITQSNSRKDGRLARHIRKAISKNHIIDSSKISVDVIDSVVMIKGQAATIAEKLFAEEEAFAVPGVRQVINNIKVCPLSPASDVGIAGDILQCLSLCLRLDLSAVFVKVRKGVAFLRGAVPTARCKLVAGTLARKIPQVIGVVNELQVAPVKAKEHKG